jgi:hypothetical protein
MAAEALLEGDAEALTRKAIELALAGDAVALRLCLERLVPPRRQRSIAFDLPPIRCAADVGPAMAAVLDALTTGTITPAEAGAVATLIEAQARTFAAEPPALPVVHITFPTARA